MTKNSHNQYSKKVSSVLTGNSGGIGVIRWLGSIAKGLRWVREWTQSRKAGSMSTALLTRADELRASPTEMQFERDINFSRQHDSPLPSTHPSYYEWNIIRNLLSNISRDSHLKRSKSYKETKNAVNIFIDKYINELPKKSISSLRELSLMLVNTSNFHLSLHLMGSYGESKKRKFLKLKDFHEGIILFYRSIKFYTIEFEFDYFYPFLSSYKELFNAVIHDETLVKTSARESELKLLSLYLKEIRSTAMDILYLIDNFMLRQEPQLINLMSADAYTNADSSSSTYRAIQSCLDDWDEWKDVMNSLATK
jgi:hypothetical protein